MKPFNLEEYLKNPNRKVVTREGRNVRIVCTDAENRYPVIALIKEGNGREEVYTFTKDGLWKLSNNNGLNDLFFAPEKHEGWINIFKNVFNDYIGQSRIFESKEAAEKEGKDRSAYIATIKIEWEE